jgi:hypothetical protein
MWCKPYGHALLTCALAVIAVITCSARASAAATIVLPDPSHASAVTLTDGTIYGAGNGAFIICAAFINNGPHMAKKVGLNLTMVDETGTVLANETLYATGRFEMGKRSAFARISQLPNGNCQIMSSADRSSSIATLRYRASKNDPVKDVAAVLVSAREIVYEEGPAYRPEPEANPKTGDHLGIPSPPPFAPAVPVGPPNLSWPAVSGAPVRITSFTASYSGAEYCLAFSNTDARTAKHVRFLLAIADRTGKIIDVEEENSSGTFATDATISSAHANCFTLKTRSDSDTFTFEGTQVGRIMAVPVLVEFSDGTSWQGPAPVVDAMVSG